MAVPEQTPYKEFTANGITTVFPLDFDVLEQDHLIVLVNDVEPSLGSWHLDSVNDSVIFNKPPEAEAKIKIRRDTPMSRSSDYKTYNNSLRPEPVNFDFDNIWRKLQEMGVLNWMIDNNVKDLNEYVDSLNDETKAIFLKMIHDQGTSLEQLDAYVDQLYKNLANVAIEKGWLAEFIATKDGKNQQQVNDSFNNFSINQNELNKITIQHVNSIHELLQIRNPANGQTVFVQNYYSDSQEGGGNFTFDSNYFFVNNKGTILNGWIRNDTSVITPETFGAKPNDESFDNSINLQAMLNTGLEFTAKAENTYSITTILDTKGQKYNGVLSLKSRRLPFEDNISNTLTVSASYSLPSADKIRGLFVASAYDLVELLKIKSLGINTIFHYSQFTNIPEDSEGTYLKLVNNAKTAGLNVVINVELIGLDTTKLASVINQIDGYDNVVGYSVVDEPASRRITVAEQDQRVANLKALTKKKLVCVDYASDTAAWLDIFSQGYDLFLVNSYSRYWAAGTTQEKINKDLELMRINFGACMKMTGSAKVIPCVQTYTDVKNNPIETAGRYAFDIDQILGASQVFAKVANGDAVYFIWDAGFDYKVRNSSDFQKFISLNSANQDHQIYKTEPLLFGGVNTALTANGFKYRQRALTELIQNIAYKDTSNTIDAFPSSGCYPVRLKKGTSETPITTLSNVDISGLGFRQSFSRLVTTKRVLKYLSVWGVLESVVNVAGSIAFEIYSTPDGGYTQIQRYTGGIAPGSAFKFSSLMSTDFDGTGETLVIGLNYTSNQDYLDNYRRIFYGLIVSTNW